MKTSTNRPFLTLLTLATLPWPSASAKLAYVGVDWSSVLVEERAGVAYRDSSGPGPLEQILKAAGVNTVRQRVWVDRPQTKEMDYGTAYNLRLAQRARAAGLEVYLDLHYSNSWADPGKQATPAGWPSSSSSPSSSSGDAAEALARQVYNYTRALCDAFQDAGVPPAVVSIGNEIRNGMLWPTGRISGGSGNSGYANLARLLKAASRGVRESSLRPAPRIMIHLDNGWDFAAQQRWYTGVLGAAGDEETPFFTPDDFDVFGVSYYPFYGAGATLASLNASLAGLARRWPGKDVVVAETDWPTACARPAQPFPADLRPVIPFSAAGQAEFLARVAGVLGGLSLQGGGEGEAKTGLFYWEPAWVDNAGLGSSCESNTMFARDGTALSSLDVFSSM